MTDLITICYVSSAVRLLSPEELDALLIDARSFNQRTAVTGALLHHDGSFLQYIEGPEASVAQAYRRIRSSTRHHNIIELDSGAVAQRHFSKWSMGFAEPTSTDLQAIAQADWKSELQSSLSSRASSPGLSVLLSFWLRSTGGRSGAA